MGSTSQNASFVSGNLSASMRDNYEQHGVAEVRLLDLKVYIITSSPISTVLQESRRYIQESPLPWHPSLSILVV